ncbi:hypothetical protein MAPG_05664, partial [Magnaporthiopsis poae ATCC 64411]
MAYVVAENGTPTAITMETVRDAAAGRYKVVAWMCEQGGGSPTSEELGSDARYKIVGLLLDQLGKEVEVTEDVVEAAAGDWRSGADVMKLLLDRQGEKVKVTERVAKAAAENPWSGKEVMELLLDGQAKVEITKELTEIIAGRFVGAMEQLLDRQGEEVKVTEEIVKAAAGNAKFNKAGAKVMELLLDRRGGDVEVTEEVVTAAARNPESGKEIMELLLDRRGKDVKVTEEVV